VSRLSKIEREYVSQPKASRYWLLGFALIGGFIVLSAVIATTAAAYIVGGHVLTTTTTVTTPTTSTTSTTTSEIEKTTTTSTSTTAKVATTTLTTTSTTLCGLEYQIPCSGNICKSGLTLNSQNICVPYECGENVRSGNSGCGSWALSASPNWCKKSGV
jgi:hypothetical protein